MANWKEGREGKRGLLLFMYYLIARRRRPTGACDYHKRFPKSLSKPARNVSASVFLTAVNAHAFIFFA